MNTEAGAAYIAGLTKEWLIGVRKPKKDEKEIIEHFANRTMLDYQGVERKLRALREEAAE